MTQDVSPRSVAAFVDGYQANKSKLMIYCLLPPSLHY
jgi:hypothetical protein